MVKKKLAKRTTVNIPRSIEGISEFIAEMGEYQRKLDKIQKELNDDIEKIKAQAIENSLPHQEALDERLEGIFTFAEKHKDELTEKGKKKTVHFPTGDISWRLTPPAVSVKDAKRVIELCRTLDLERFIRVKEEVDKTAMLKEPKVASKIQGVTIEQEEEFIVKPSETKIEIPRVIGKFKGLV